VVAVTVSDPLGGGEPEFSTTAYTLQITDVSPEKITGTSAGEALFGGTDADVMFGLGGNDTLVGYEGNDTLIGGLGTDDLVGGLGSDTFVFNKKGEAPKGLAHDSITDFSGFGNEGDLINVHAMDANTHKHGNPGFQIYRG
jgi:serralysin